ncbi:MAG: hypothetical protein A2X36_03975 [Elusimicrobia bacterium GWA2_69_24]|nr:MAG: hypothetical protein A2X36_03975 [Elusimicrobia bacterium GWA2_69_24]
MKPPLRTALLAAAALAALAAILETGLRLQERRAVPAGTTPTVLCLGDDLVSGESAYPAMLRAALKTGPGARREVLVESDPALDSAALLDRVDALLLRHRPEVVVASVGPGTRSPGARLLRGLGELRLVRFFRRPQRAAPPAVGAEASPWEYFELARAYLAQRRPERAETALRQHLVLSPKDAAARTLLAETLRELGRRGDSQRARQAAEEADRAFHLDPSSARARRLRRILRRELGLEPAAETAALERGIARDLAELLRRVTAHGARLVLIPYPDGTTPSLTGICASPDCSLLALKGDADARVIAKQVQDAAQRHQSP